MSYFRGKSRIFFDEGCSVGREPKKIHDITKSTHGGVQPLESNEKTIFEVGAESRPRGRCATPAPPGSAPVFVFPNVIVIVSDYN